MAFDQVTYNEKAGTHLFPLDPVVGIASDALDMELLNSFEDLQSEGGTDLIIELIDLYLDDAPKRIQEITEAAGNADWRLLKRAAHNLKGSSGNLGVRHVTEICEELEVLESNHSSPGVEKLVQQLSHEFGIAREVFLAERRRRVH